MYRDDCTTKKLSCKCRREFRSLNSEYLIGYKKLTWNYFQVVRNLIDGYFKSKRKIKKIKSSQEPGVKGKKAQGRRHKAEGTRQKAQGRRHKAEGTR
jgi:hypothetical protein